MDWQREVADSDEFLDALKMDLSAFRDHVYCFTPTGDVISLVNGSCVIDFAYAVHSAVGNRMTGARVEGKIVPVDYVLSTGNRVEIITSQNSKGPSRDWLKIVKTSSARTKITQWFNRESRDENIRKGREALENSAKEAGVAFEILLADGREADVLDRFNCKTIDILAAMVGIGGLKEKMVVNHLMRAYEKVQPLPTDAELIAGLLEAGAKESKPTNISGIVIRGIGDTAVRFGKCCGPLPGDEVVGFVTRGRGLTIHRTDCVNIMAMDELDRRRLIDARWQDADKTGRTFHTDLRIICDDRDGLLVDISRVLTDEKIKVKSLNGVTRQSEAIFNVGVELSGGDQLVHLQGRLKNVPGVHEIARVSG
jgi:GTP pyrophosphokinase